MGFFVGLDMPKLMRKNRNPLRRVWRRDMAMLKDIAGEEDARG